MMAQASRARGEGSVTARLLQSAPAVISQGSGRARAETGMQRPWSRRQRKLRTQGTAAVTDGGSFRAQLGGGEYEMACWPTPSPAFISVFGVAERFFPPNFR